MTARHLLLALLLGAACGGVIAWTLSGPGGEASTGDPALVTNPVPREMDEVPAAAPQRKLPGPTLLGSADAGAADAARQERMAQRLEQVEAQLADVMARLATLEGGPEKTDLSALSDDELTARASSLYAFKNYAGAVEAYEALLARELDLDEESRGKVLSAMAQCHRALGNLKQADETFQQIEALHGAGSAGALTAHYHRAWIRQAQSDLEGARSFMREVASADNSPIFWKLFSRANAADFSIQMGDTAHVRSDLEEFKVELEGDDSPTGQRVLTYVNNLLERLDG